MCLFFRRPSRSHTLQLQLWIGGGRGAQRYKLKKLFVFFFADTGRRRKQNSPENVDKWWYETLAARLIAISSCIKFILKAIIFAIACWHCQTPHRSNALLAMCLTCALPCACHVLAMCLPSALPCGFVIKNERNRIETVQKPYRNRLWFRDQKRQKPWTETAFHWNQL